MIAQSFTKIVKLAEELVEQEIRLNHLQHESRQAGKCVDRLKDKLFEALDEAQLSDRDTLVIPQEDGVILIELWEKDEKFQATASFVESIVNVENQQLFLPK